jgi:hypothetical protein
VPNYTPAPLATDHIGAHEPPIPLAGVGRDDITEVERLARVAELTLERFTPAPEAGARSTTCRAERAVVRHLQRAARNARAAADRTQMSLATTSRSSRYGSGLAVGGANVTGGRR